MKLNKKRSTLKIIWELYDIYIILFLIFLGYVGITIINNIFLRDVFASICCTLVEVALLFAAYTMITILIGMIHDFINQCKFIRKLTYIPLTKSELDRLHLTNATEYFEWLNIFLKEPFGYLFEEKSIWLKVPKSLGIEIIRSAKELFPNENLRKIKAAQALLQYLEMGNIYLEDI